MDKKHRLVLLIALLLVLLLSACQSDKNSSQTISKYEVDSLVTEIAVIYDSLSFSDNDVSIEKQDQPKLCIIIDDFGNYNNFMLDSLLFKFGELPSEVAFAILPNLPYSEFVMEYFQIEDRELLLHAPLEPQNSKINAGEIVIKSDDDAITVINKLNDFYAKLPKVNGLNNHMGSKTTESPEVMTTILEWCKTNNLYFIDSATTSNSVAFELAKEIGLPTAKRDIFLDVPNPAKETVDNYLKKMQKHFDAKRDILVITHSSTLERRDNLQYFITEAEKIGFKLVPVSEYISSENQPI